MPVSKSLWPYPHFLTILAVTACAAQSKASPAPVPVAASATRPTTAPSSIAAGARAIAILPQASRVCPGQPIDVRYSARFADGSQRALRPSDITPVVRGGADAEVEPRPDGNWLTNADPMRSVLTGFRLSVTLAGDSSVRGDTVVAPSYECSHTAINLPSSDRFNHTTAYVRLGTFATPFYDSVVVAVVEVEGRAPIVTILAPNQMHSGAIKVSAPGKNGAPGRAGRIGSEGGPCANGEQGEDGEPGEPGEAGGEVDIIMQDGSPWLAGLVAVSNPGGKGGAGGAGGRGGTAGPSGRQGGGGSCSTKAGRSGRPGRPSTDGPAGASRVTSVISQLLWSGSPIWSDLAARRAIEGLTNYDPKRRG